MKIHRFYTSQLKLVDFELKEPYQVHQMYRVLRLRVGETVELFCGDMAGRFKIQSISSASVSVIFDTQIDVVPRTKRTILLCALIKKDNFEWVVEKATELGVNEIIPVVTARTEKKDINMTRLATIAREAVEQSGWTTLPVIHEPLGIAEISAQTILGNEHVSNEGCAFVCLLGQPGQYKSLKEVVGQKKVNHTCAIFVGPEGGFTPEEEIMIQESGFTPVSLGTSVLRAETAAITGVVLLTQ